MEGSDSYRTLLLLCLHQKYPATTATITPMMNRGTRMPAAIAPPLIGFATGPGGIVEGEGVTLDELGGVEVLEKVGEGAILDVPGGMKVVEGIEKVGSIPEDKKELEEMKGCELDELRTGPRLETLGGGTISVTEGLILGMKMEDSNEVSVKGSNEALLLLASATQTVMARNSSIIFMIVPSQT